MQWMRASIPEFSFLICPMAKIWQEGYAQVEKRTRLAAGRVFLRNIHWHAEHEDAFQQCNIAFDSQVPPAHID